VKAGAARVTTSAAPAVARRIGVAVAAIGTLVLTGWLLDIPRLTGLAPGLVTMKANTALAFLLGGAAVWWRGREWPHLGSTLLAAVITVIAGLTLIEYRIALPFDLDQMLVPDPHPLPVTAAPGRMGEITAACFATAGTALMLAGAGRKARVTAQWLALLEASVGAVALVGYAYSVQSPPGLVSYTQMAIHTAAAHTLLGLGIAALTADAGIVAVVIGSGPGGMFTRNVLPAVLLGPFIIGWFRLLGQRNGLYGTEFGVAILVIFSSATLAAAVLFFATRIERFDAERRRAAGEAQRQHEHMRFALTAAQMNTWEVDLATGRLDWSDAMPAMFGPAGPPRTRAEFFQRVHADDRPAVERSVGRALAGRGDHVVEFRTVWSDGTIRWIYGRARVTFTERGEPAALTGIALDVTERKELEHRLHQAQKLEAIGQLAGGVAHDFNNVLTAIIGYSDLLLLDTRDGGVRADLEEIRKAGNRATAITQQLLAFGRRQLLHPKLVDVNQLVVDLEKMLRRLVPEHVELALRLDAGAGQVMADPTQIEQILINLVVNSRDAMPKGGLVTIETANSSIDETLSQQHAPARAGDYVQLTVTDTGVGMARETQEKVFEPFFTTKEVGQGTGLGLATVYGIVQQSGGYVWLYSEPGHGTTFKVFLPRVREGTEAAEPRRRQATRDGSETILLVEDEPGVRALARRILELRGYRVLEAGNPAEAVAVGRNHHMPIHLLLSDVVMPGSGAISIFDELAPTQPAMRVLYMSGYADETVVAQGLLHPGARLLKKPFTAQSLADAVREVLDIAPAG